MISCINTIPSGRAISIYLNPPSTAVIWRLLRSLTNNFTDQDGAGLIYQGEERQITDIAGLENGIAVWYKPFYFDGNIWSTAPAKTITPGISLVDRSVDVQSLVRDRIDYSMNAMIGQGVLSHPNGIIPVLTESPQIESINFPCITVHLQTDIDENRFLGDTFQEDIYEDGSELVTDIEGYYSRVSLEIVIWSQNGDERLAYRKALKTALISNLQVFSAFEIEEPKITFTDTEDFDSYQFPLYITNCNFNCLAPSVATGKYIPVTDIAIETAITFGD